MWQFECWDDWAGVALRKVLKIHYIVFIINGNDRGLLVIFPFVMSTVIWGCCGNVKWIMQWYCSIWFCFKIPSFLIFMIRTQKNDILLPFSKGLSKAKKPFPCLHYTKQTSIKRILHSSYGWRNRGTEGKIQILRLLLNASPDPSPFPRLNSKPFAGRHKTIHDEKFGCRTWATQYFISCFKC